MVVKVNAGKWGQSLTPGYADEMAESLHDYLLTCIDSDKLFLMGDWCFANQINHKNTGKLDALSEDFKIVHAAAMAYQEHSLTKGSLTKKLDGNFAKTVLACKHGWKVNGETTREDELKSDFRQFLECIKEKHA